MTGARNDEPRAREPKRSLECSACGYGIAPSVPPERCPMCQREGTWIRPPWRLYAGRRFA